MCKGLTRVMLVDDDALISEFAMMVLEARGFDVLHCPSGETALTAAAGFRPQLVLLDFVMPGMSGAETLAALQRLAETKATPVIYLTGRAGSESDVAELTAAGAIGVIQKPFEPANLVARITELWRRHVD